MDSKIFRALIQAGAVRQVRIIADGSRFRVEVDTGTDTAILHTLKGQLKTWGSLNAAARWLHTLGIGKCQLELGGWQPSQKDLKF